LLQWCNAAVGLRKDRPALTLQIQQHWKCPFAVPAAQEDADTHMPLHLGLSC
jgi:hypothetical protein